jgi:hypothetical protein
MMPCKLCSPGDGPPLDKDGKLLRGFKQVGKTKRADVVVLDPSRGHDLAGVAENARGVRHYRCQDCGARWRMTFNAVDRAHTDAPELELIGAEQ